jgi:REP element-mobilizing transposase RayT
MEPHVSAARRHGGARPGAGRKRSGRRLNDSPHRTRPDVDPRHPIHVVLRSERVRRLGLRNSKMYRALRHVLVRYLAWTDFRLVHVSIQTSHLHVLVEATNRAAFERGMRSLTINAARAINRTLLGCGNVFEYRYHATHIKTERYARHALAYVLNNWRRHREDFENGRMRTAKLDPYASGVSFDGWVGAPRFALPGGYVPLPVAPAQTQLLRVGWRSFGRVDPFEVPALWRERGSLT